MARQSPTQRTGRKRAHARNPAQSRKALLDAAATLFNTVGYHGTDSNRIAQRAGYAPGTFYTHFADKLAIFLAVYEIWVSEEWTMMQAILASKARGAALRSLLAGAILDHHRRWRIFRASLRAVCATDAAARAARLVQREKQISLLEQTVRSLGRTGLKRADLWYMLLAFEVVCDSIAEGEAAALTVPEQGLVAILESLLAPVVG